MSLSKAAAAAVETVKKTKGLQVETRVASKVEIVNSNVERKESKTEVGSATFSKPPRSAEG